MAEPTFRKEVLENGLTILTEKVDHVRSISLGVWLKKGSRNETPKEAGIYHFIEHMLFKGTEKKNAYEIAKIMDSIGGYTDAFTSKEHTCFYAKMLDEHLPIILELFGDILISPTFEPEEIDRERKVILEEIKMVEDTPSDLVHELFLENYWADHPLGRPILGSVANVNAVDQKLLRECFLRDYTPPNMLLTAAGNIDHDRLVEQVRHYFKLRTSHNGHDTAAQPPVHPNPIVMVRPKNDLEQAHICIGMMGFSANHPHRYAESILNVILGGSMSSRLFQRIREERGLCYTVFSSLNPFKDAGYVTIYAGTSPENVKTTIELTLAECELLVKQHVSDDELENAKNHLKGSLILGLEGSSNRMFTMARNDLYHDRQVSAEEILEKISAVTADDVQHVAMELFHHSDYGVVVVGDLEDLDIPINDLHHH
jgi:predicted Zn-dependent peptidase